MGVRHMSKVWTLHSVGRISLVQSENVLINLDLLVLSGHTLNELFIFQVQWLILDWLPSLLTLGKQECLLKVFSKGTQLC